MRSIIWAASPASACTTTSRPWSCGTTPTARLYNPKFLAFATHYGFRPQACRVRRPQTKGKVERKFHYVETNLLNGRTFDTLEHLNEVTAWWLAQRRRRPRLARLQGIAARAP